MKLKFIGDALVCPSDISHIGTRRFTHGTIADWRESSEHGAQVWQVNVNSDLYPLWITADKSQWVVPVGNGEVIGVENESGIVYQVKLDDMPDVPVYADWSEGLALQIGQRVQADAQHYLISQTF